MLPTLLFARTNTIFGMKIQKFDGNYLTIDDEIGFDAQTNERNSN